MIVVQVVLKSAGALGTAARFAVEKRVGDQWVRQREVVALPGHDGADRRLLIEGHERLVVEPMVGFVTRYDKKQMMNFLEDSRVPAQMDLFGSLGGAEPEPILDAS